VTLNATHSAVTGNTDERNGDAADFIA